MFFVTRFNCILYCWDSHGEYSYVKTYGYVPPKWVSFFLQEIPKHGSHFSWKKKSLAVGLIFKFGCIFVAKSQKNWYFFFGKIPKYGYQFLEKITLNKGMGLILLWFTSGSYYGAAGGTFLTNPNLSTPPPTDSHHLL